MAIPRWKWLEKVGASEEAEKEESKPIPKPTVIEKTVSKTTTARRRRLEHTQEFADAGGPQPTIAQVIQDFKSGVTPVERQIIDKAPKPSGPSITSGQQLRIQAVKDLSGHVRQYKEIDPSATYVYESGKQISGSELQQRMGRGIQQYLLGVTKIKPGMYVESGGQHYRVTSGTRYLIEHAEPREKADFISSFGKTGYEGLPSDFVGPVIPPIITTSKKAYESLIPGEKEEYGFRFQPFREEPVETWKHYPGGERYVKEHKEETLKAYYEQIGGVEHVPVDFYKYTSIGGIYSGKMPTDPEFKRSQAWDIISIPEQERREQYFSILPGYARVLSSSFHAVAGAATFPITLPQAAIKLTTGATVGPDVSGFLYGVRPDGPKGLISTGIEEGLERAPWMPFGIVGHPSDAWDKFVKYPVSGIGATIGEIFGLYLGGKALHVGKVGAIRGLGYARSGIEKTTGFTLPGYTQIMYYTPGRIIRRAWVKLGTKDIEKTMGIPYHSAETLTPGGLSFAPGKTPTSRITWTIGKTEATKGLAYSGEDYLLSSASASRVGMRFTIKSQVLHELPGFSTTPYGFAPTRFYRFTPSGLSYSSGTSLFPHMRTPTGFAIRIQKIFKPPKVSYEVIGEWAKAQPKGSWGVIGPKMYIGGPEAEINIFGKTVLKRFLPESKGLFHRVKGYEFYTQVPLEGGLKEVVPVVFTETIHKGFPSGVKTILGSDISARIKAALGSSYTTGPTTAIISPSYLLSQALAPYHIPSSVPSYPSPLSFSIPSPSRSTSKPSSPSSLPSIVSIPSYLSGSQPSYPSKPSSPLSPLSSLSSPSIPSIPSIPSSPSIVSGPSYPSVPSSPSIVSGPSYYPLPLPSPYVPFGHYKKKKKYLEVEGARKRVHPTILLNIKFMLPEGIF